VTTEKVPTALAGKYGRMDAEGSGRRFTALLKEKSHPAKTSSFSFPSLYLVFSLKCTLLIKDLAGNIK
jgi:hypothetical protein